MKQIKCKVVMLSTEKVSEIVLVNTNSLCLSKSIYPEQLKGFIEQGSTYQHLYILSNEEIKKGEYVYTNSPSVLKSHQDFPLNHYAKKDFKKVIATTDESLNLPRPSDSFIKKYCELGGIDEVLVDYEENWVNDYMDAGYYEYKLKVAPDNTITIHPIKSTYTREEIQLKVDRFNNILDERIILASSFNTKTAYTIIKHNFNELFKL